MTDQPSISPSDETHEDAQDLSGNFDPLLVSELNQADRLGLATDITLTVGGFVISGVPTPLSMLHELLGQDYEQGFHNMSRQADTPSAAETWERVGANLRSEYKRRAKEDKLPSLTDKDESGDFLYLDGMPDTPPVRREHVALRNAVMLTPSGERIHLRYWRGRLNHVSGWFLGRPGGFEYEGPEVNVD